MSEQVTALVLAGKRGGAIDPLAAAADVDHKCLVPVAGRAMILYILEALAATPAIGRIIVSIDDTTVLDTLPQVRSLRESGRLVIAEAQPNLVDSILFATREAEFPLLITTADNVHWTSASVARFVEGALAAKADAAAAFARREAVMAAHPDGQRRFYAFSEDAYSNGNTYWIGSRDALSAAEVFRSGGQFAKHPARIIGAFGLINLIRFRYGIGTLAGAFARFSRRFRITIVPIVMDDGATAIDVDNPRTLAVAETILGQRAALAEAAE